MGIIMSLGPNYAVKEVQQLLGDSANKYTIFIFGHDNQKWNMPDNIEFKWDGWLIGYQYPKQEFSDSDLLMRHHLCYNYGCRLSDDINDSVISRVYKGEPPKDYIFEWPPDHRHLDIKVKIDPFNFCGIVTNWSDLLGTKLPAYAKCFSNEQERLYLIDTDKYYWIINYGYS